jgi:alpha-mannosidase
MMQKHRKITQERLDKFHSTESWTDVNLRSTLYRARAPVRELSVWSAPDTTRPTFATASKQTYVGAKIGQSFGPSWTTHWFRVAITVPTAWAGEEVHFLWDAQCEGLLFVNGEPVQGLLGGNGVDRRAE